jgi:hypothetical protein
MSTLREPKSASRYDFGFEDIMATASFDGFPAWYADRCLLPNGSKKPLRIVETMRPTMKAHAFAKKAA